MVIIIIDCLSSKVSVSEILKAKDIMQADIVCMHFNLVSSKLYITITWFDACEISVDNSMTCR